MFRLTHVFVAAFVVAVFAGCVSQEQYRRALADADNLRAQRDAQQEYQQKLEQENADLRAQLAELQARVPDVDWIEAQKRRIEEILKGGALPANVDVYENPEGVVFGIQGEVLFASGSADLTPSGQSTLQELVPTLVAQNKRLRVEGHTDSDPIKQSRWGTNLRLSVERAMAVAEFLKKAGVPEDRVSVAGYGEFVPRTSNETDDGKRQNRRVEILIRKDG